MFKQRPILSKGVKFTPQAKSWGDFGKEYRYEMRKMDKHLKAHLNTLGELCGDDASDLFVVCLDFFQNPENCKHFGIPHNSDCFDPLVNRKIMEIIEKEEREGEMCVSMCVYLNENRDLYVQLY